MRLRPDSYCPVKSITAVEDEIPLDCLHVNPLNPLVRFDRIRERVNGPSVVFIAVVFETRSRPVVASNWHPTSTSRLFHLPATHPLMTTSDRRADFALSRGFPPSDHSTMLAQALASNARDFNIAIWSHLRRAAETASLKSLLAM
jgi:hypothetical protein